MKLVRFRTLGCYPLTGRGRDRTRRRCRRSSRKCCSTKTRERQGRVIDHDEAGSMEEKKTRRVLLDLRSTRGQDHSQYLYSTLPSRLCCDILTHISDMHVSSI